MANFRVEVRGVNAAFRDLLEDLRQEVGELTEEEVQDFENALVAATPVDTGRARAGWQVGQQSRDSDGETEIVVFNEVDYIDELNAGTSRQAPARFIERTALRFFDPTLGTIVERRR